MALSDGIEESLDRGGDGGVSRKGIESLFLPEFVVTDETDLGLVWAAGTDNEDVAVPCAAYRHHLRCEQTGKVVVCEDGLDWSDVVGAEDDGYPRPLPLKQTLHVLWEG
jgi:hypothetical protein